MANNIKVTNSRYRLGYHIMAPQGWINDPNGFCFFKGYYHIFYQFHPESAEWGPMHWGHARSTDLVHWETLPIALTPGDSFDKDGCFSGSAIIKGETLYLFYTGHHYYADNNPEHFWQDQNMAYSTDGIHFEKYSNNPIIAKEPSGSTQHFRDPKVWEHAGKYYMILGNQSSSGLGRVILYTSDDLKKWEYLGPITTSKDIHDEGYMWECPDLFNLSGTDILLVSPQGIEPREKKYRNLYETGYFMGKLNYEINEYQRGHFTELDNGHDFYATQTMLTPDGRRIVFGWMSMWESKMPEQVDGWAGALTVPRELKLKNNHLLMKPVKELDKLRVGQGHDFTKMISEKALIYNDINVSEICLKVGTRNKMKFICVFKNEDDVQVLKISYNNGELTIWNKDKKDCRYANVANRKNVILHFFIDRSSLELFVNDGEASVTERYYSEKALQLWMDSDSAIRVVSKRYNLANNVIEYDSLSKIKS